MRPIYAAILAFCIGSAGPRCCASEKFAQPRTLEDTQGQEFIHPYTTVQRASALSEIPHVAEAKFTGAPQTNVELRDYSITLDSKGKFIPILPPVARTGTVCGYRSPVHSLIGYYPVTRPGESNFVAIIKTIGETSVVLNPIQGFDYGPIPLLTSLTLEQADDLWGKAIKEDALDIWRQKTYELDSMNVNGISKKFLLTCSFKQGILNRFKISGRAITNNHAAFVMDERKLRY